MQAVSSGPRSLLGGELLELETKALFTATVIEVEKNRDEQAHIKDDAANKRRNCGGDQVKHQHTGIDLRFSAQRCHNESGNETKGCGDYCPDSEQDNDK